MRRRIEVMSACLVVAAAITGCTAPTPAAEDLRDAAQDVRDSSPRPLLVEPQPGKGTADLPEFTVDGPYTVIIRCLGSASVGLTIDDEEVPAEDCSDGMRGVGRDGSGESVRVSVDAPDGVSWVAGVSECEAVDDGVIC